MSSVSSEGNSACQFKRQVEISHMEAQDQRQLSHQW